jgi:hypothetical protein
MNHVRHLLQHKDDAGWSRIVGGALAHRALYGLLVLTLFAQPALAGARTWSDAAAAPVGALTAPAAGTPIVSWEYDQVRAAVAYASESATYLVVWQDHHWAWGEARDIYAQRVNADGSLVGGRFAVPATGSQPCLSPDVVYNPVADEFLVVWESENSPDNHDIYARRVGTNGSLVGDEIAIATLTRHEATPVVAFSPSANAYVVVYERREGTDATGPMNVVAQYLDAVGTPSGAPVLVSASLYDQLAPDVAYNAATGGYLVVWQDTVYVPPLERGAATTTSPLEFDIYARRLDSDGSVLGDPIAISTWQYDQVKPRLAYNDATDQFLIVWEDHHWGWGEARDIYAQRVNANGSLAGGNFAVSWEGTEFRLNPDVAYNPTAGEFLAVWEYALSESDHDVYRRRISSSGALPDDELAISRLGSHEGTPVVAADEGWSYLTVWEDGRNAGTLGLDLYADLVRLHHFSGYVYEGDVGDEGSPLRDVLVELYCSNNSGYLGDLVATSRTSRTGSYGLTVAQICEFYNIVQTTPDGYTPVGATSISGTIVDSHWIQYTYPLEGVTLSDNKFWNQSVALLPDLVITDSWSESGAICYQILNAGDALAPAGHLTALFVDGAQVASDSVDADLDPAARSSGCFDYTWACTPTQDTIAIRADYTDIVAELDETNNLHAEDWTCDTTPPVIISGPTATAITQNSAHIAWETDESADSLVRYGTGSGAYTHQQQNANLVTLHSLNLTDLAPSTTYRFVALSSDASGNTIVSQEQTFQTLPVADATLPVVTLTDPGLISGTVRLSAVAFDDIGVDKVEFWIGDQLLFSDYSPPYQMFLDSYDYDNGNYVLAAKVFDYLGNHVRHTIEAPIANVLDTSLPHVEITAPNQWATVSGVVPVKVSVSDDEGLAHGYFWVGPTPQWHTASWFAGYSFPKQHTIEIDWKSTGAPNGPLRIAWEIHDKYGNVGWDYQDVIVDNPEPPASPKLVVTKRDIVRTKNYFTINLTVKNTGGQAATAITIWDYLQLFQPIDNDNNVASYQSEYNHQFTRWKVEINSKVDIPKGGERTFSYEAVPVMTPESAGPYEGCPYPMIGAYALCGNGSWKWEGDTHVQYKQLGGVGYFHEWVNLGKKLPGTTYFTATNEADYLIVTHPGNLFAQNTGHADDVNALLSDMAELAKLRNGVLGFLNITDPNKARNEFRNLLKPGLGWSKANWAYRLHHDFSTPLKGYLLIVGETNIVPSFDLNAGKINHSDHPYSALTGTDEMPELIVGRIIGDNAADLRKPIETSTGIAEGVAGYGLDHSDALVVSGHGEGYNNFKSYAVKAKTLLDSEFSTDILHCSDYFDITTFSSSYGTSDALVVGDVRGDANLEIMIADHGTGLIDIHDGNGNYVDSQSSSFRKGDGFVSGDVLGGAQSEIIVIKEGLDQAYIYDPQMNEQAHFPVGWDGQHDKVVLGNITGDDKLEILVARWSPKRIYAYNSLGQEVGNIPMANISIDGLAASDFAGNSYDDIFIVDAGSDKLYVYNTEDTQWQEYSMPFDPGDGFAATNLFYGPPAEMMFFRYATNTVRVISYDLKNDKLVEDFWVEGGYAKNDAVVLGNTRGTWIAQYIVANSIGNVKISDFDCQSRWKTDFGSEFRDNDLVYFHEHGNPDSSAVHSSEFKNLDFGSSNPVLISDSCSTGNYEKGELAQAFLQAGGSVFIGPTEDSNMDDNRHRILKNWVNTHHSIGQAFVMQERELIAIDKNARSVRQYNLYGDPKLGVAPTKTVAAAPGDMTEDAPISIDVVVPDYDVTSSAIYDYVDIPGGMGINEHGMPDIPLYFVTVDYPKGYEIQSVELAARSGLATTTGLNLPYVDLIYDCEDPDPEQLADMTWYPEKVFEWSAVDNENGTTLYIVMYPFYYNHHSTDIKFYKNYSFDIDYAASDVAVTGLLTDKDEYAQDETVIVDVELENAGEAQSVLVSAVVKHYGSGEIVDGLPLRTLSEFSGIASFSAGWDTTGYEPGYYSVEVTLKDRDGLLFDRTTQMFRLGISSGEVSGFTATPKVFTGGDQIDISMAFDNTGTVPINGTAVVQLLTASGEMVKQFRDDINDLAPGNAVNLEHAWDTSGVGLGMYRILGYVQYDSKASEPVSLYVSAGTPIYLPILLR